MRMLFSCCFRPPTQASLLNFTQTENPDQTAFGVCIICWDSPCEILLFPCKHLIMCKHCSEIYFWSNSICPLCRGSIKRVFRLAEVSIF